MVPLAFSTYCDQLEDYPNSLRFHFRERRSLGSAVASPVGVGRRLANGKSRMSNHKNRAAKFDGSKSASYEIGLKIKPFLFKSQLAIKPIRTYPAAPPHLLLPQGW
jgi:hypothetical protein